MRVAAIVSLIAFVTATAAPASDSEVEMIQKTDNATSNRSGNCISKGMMRPMMGGRLGGGFGMRRQMGGFGGGYSGGGAGGGGQPLVVVINNGGGSAAATATTTAASTGSLRDRSARLRQESRRKVAERQLRSFIQS